MNEENTEQVSPPESSLNDAQDAQINRMAGCARLGKRMLQAVLLFLAMVLLYNFFGPPGIRLHPISHRVKTRMKNIEIATGHFKTEYGAFPMKALMPAQDVELRSQGDIIAALTNEDDQLNPRQIKFLDLDPAKEKKNGAYQENGQWVLVDPWGEMYYILLDGDKDGHVANPEGTTPEKFERPMIIYSSGPDRDPRTWKDNICSWR